MYRLLFIVFIISCSSVFGELTFQDARFSNRTIRTGQFFNKYITTRFETISGELVNENTTQSIEGKIVYIRSIPKEFLWKTLFDLQNRGVKGVISSASGRIPGRSYCTYNGEDFLQDVVIPIVQVSKFDFDDGILPVLQQGETLNITLASDGNLWYETYNSPLFTGLFRGVLGAMSAALVVYATVVLAIFIRAQGSQFNIPQVCLGLEVVANIIRLIYLAADPFGCFFNLQTITSNILESITLPFNVATFVLITFYWYEAITDASIKIYQFLSKLQVPFFVLTFLLIAIDFMFSFLDYYRGVRDTEPLLVIYLVISAGFLVFYTITVVRVAKRMQRPTETPSATKKISVLQQVNKRMIMGGIVKLILVVYAIIWAGISSEAESPVPFVTKWAVLFVALMLDSFCRIFLFNVKKAAKTKSKSKNTSTKKTLEAVTLN